MLDSEYSVNHSESVSVFPGETFRSDQPGSTFTTIRGKNEFPYLCRQLSYMHSPSKPLKPEVKQYKYHIFHDCQEFSLICETQCSEEIMSELRDSDSDSSLSEDSLETSVRTEQSLVSVAAPDKISCALCVSRTKGKASMDQPSLPHSPSLFA